MHNATHVIDWNFIQVEPEGDMQIKPDCILDKRESFLQNRTVEQVKVQWKHLNLDEATWELESHMWEAYLGLF